MALTTASYCTAHASTASQQREAGRQTARERGYTTQWQAFRERWLREYPLCGDREGGPSDQHSRCLAQGMATPATDVDHIVDHKGDTARFWDRANLQSLCHPCHSAKTLASLQRGG